MSKDNKNVVLDIDNVRVIRNDPLNLSVERLESSYSTKHKKEVSSYRFKGYYSNILKAVQAIQSKELLINEKSITDLKSYLEQVQESNDKLYEAVERISEHKLYNK